LTRERWLTPTDRDLLEELGRSSNLVRACRALGIGRDEGMYRLSRLARIAGRPIVITRRGGARGGATQLSRFGEALRRTPAGAFPRRGRPTGRLSGRFHSEGGPRLRLAGGLELAVGFRAPEGARVEVALDPEAVLLARGRFLSSARNVLAGEVTRIRPRGDLSRLVEVRVGRTVFASAVTPAAVSALGLRPGVPVYLYLKATALRPTTVPVSPGPLPR
jgi:molybdate transport system regulatory protein